MFDFTTLTYLLSIVSLRTPTSGKTWDIRQPWLVF